MLTLTSLEYELNEQPDQVINRIKWAVTGRKESWFKQLTAWDTSSDAPEHWIGATDPENLRFKLREPGNSFRKGFGVVIKGSIKPGSAGVKVQIKLGLENFSVARIISFYLGAAVVIWAAFTHMEFDSYFYLLFLLIGYLLFGLFLITARLKGAERKLDILFA